VLIETHLVFLGKAFTQQGAFLGESVEDAPLTVDPTSILGSEQTVKESMRNLLRRQRTAGTRPAHILLYLAAERLLRDADL
jgi:hypothetical protein